MTTQFDKIYFQPNNTASLFDPTKVNTNVAMGTVSFSPRDMPNIFMWFDAADSSTIDTISNGVNVWRDKSGRGNNVTYNATYTRPDYTDTINGLNVVTFGGTKQLDFSSSLAIPNQQKTYFVVFKQTADIFVQTGKYILFLANFNAGFANFGTDGFTSGTYGMTCGPNADGTNGLYYQFTQANYNLNGNTTMYSVIHSSSSGRNTMAITGNTANINSSVSPAINGAAVAYNTGASSANGDYTMSVATTRNSNYIVPYQLAEFIMYTGYLTTSQRQQIEGYLAWKWGLTGNLPSDHPYKNTIVYSQPQFPTETPIIPPFPMTVRINQFNPKQISNMLLWFDAADQSSFTMNVSNQLTGITDKSGAGATGITFDSTTVTWSATALNGYPAFNTTSGHFRGAFGTAMTNFYTHTAFIVTWLTGAQGDRGYPCLGFGEAATGSTTNYRALDTDQAPGTDTFRTVAFFGGGSGVIEIATRQTTSPFISSESYSSTTDLINGYYNGGGLNSTSRADPGSTATHFFVACGSDTVLYNVNTWNGLISEIIVYNTTLSEADMKRIEGYLAWKWGLQGSLAFFHPFKNFPPPP